MIAVLIFLFLFKADVVVVVVVGDEHNIQRQKNGVYGARQFYGAIKSVETKLLKQLIR